MCYATIVKRIIALSAILCVACTHSAEETDRLTDVWSNPLRHNGEAFNLTIFPYDYGGASVRICFEPCSRADAARELAVLRPASARFIGADGQQAYEVRVVFRADCFEPNALCGHTPYVFEEVQG